MFNVWRSATSSRRKPTKSPRTAPRLALLKSFRQLTALQTLRLHENPLPALLASFGQLTALQTLRGETAGFRDYRWTNIDLASPVWLSDDQCALSVTFEAADGAVVTLPDRRPVGL